MADVIGFDPVAYSIDGGLHPGLLLRTAQYASTGNTEGVVSGADCRVHQLATPGRGVAIDPGAILIRNPSARNQTYVANASSLTTLDTPASTSVPRSYLVLVQIEDPEYGWPDPASLNQDPRTYQYTKPVLSGPVPPTTTSAKQLNLSYSIYALARIDVPANTTTITDSMITDLRNVANPLSANDLSSATMPATGGAIDTTSWKTWPENLGKSIYVPEWATHIAVKIDYSGVVRDGGSIGVVLRARVHDFHYAGEVVLEYDAGLNGYDDAARESFFVTAYTPIPVNRRGVIIDIATEGRRVDPTTYSGVLRSTDSSQVSWDIRFYEKPE